MATTSRSTADPNTPTRRPSRTRRTGRTRGYAVLAATGAGLLGWAVADPAAGVDLTVRLGSAAAPQHIGPATIAVACLLAGLAAWASLAILERLVPQAAGIWTVIAVIVLALSLAGPLAGVTTGAKIALTCLHLVVAAVLIAGLRRSAGRR